jgi:hypothetical protein
MSASIAAPNAASEVATQSESIEVSSLMSLSWSSASTRQKAARVRTEATRSVELATALGWRTAVMSPSSEDCIRSI